MTVKGGSSQACAACKFQRRKCTADCPLAPYFPPDKPKQFENAHRLFGVSNIIKILKQLDPHQKLEAMRSIVYQAEIRHKYPVHGCLGIVYSLHFQIHQIQQELDAVNAQLAIYRQQHHQISSPPPPSSQLQLAPALTLFHNHHHNQQFNTINVTATGAPVVATQHPFLNNATAESSSNSNSNLNNNNNLNQMWSHYSYPHSYDNNSSVVQSQFIAAQPLPCQQQATLATHGFDEMSTFLEAIDDRQSYVESKESSSESSLKDTQSMERIGENNMKSAATCLPLTSVN